MKGELLPVEQRHREAANALRQRQAERIMRAIKDEKAAKVLGDDEGDIALDVQAFAHFERDHLSSLTAQLDKAREALGRIANGKKAGQYVSLVQAREIAADALSQAARACLPATSGDVAEA